ncbi:MAG: hypothetical protein EOM26_11530 [Alphaproteobacteria bacterium]|nr:hypothetical protein [Alphaproteobacteria bacterium]
MPVSIVQRFLGALVLVVIAAGLIMPSFTLFVPPSDPLSPQEEFCAWRAAREFAYDTPVERFFIRNHTTVASPYGPGHYTVFPVSFFSLPWQKAHVQCVLGRNGRLIPYEGWTETPGRN